MTTYLYEVRRTKVRKDKVQLHKYEDLAGLKGFRSVYGYGPEAIAHIQSTGATAGLIGAPVFSNLLLVDFDECPEDAHKMAEELRAYDWVKFDSGGRSVHLHVRIIPMYGEEVPTLQKEWVRKYYPKADLSIYRTSGMYRLAGTYHEKNPGKFKRVLEVNTTGNSLVIERVEVPKTIYTPQIDLDSVDLEDKLVGLLGKEVTEGTSGRNTHVFKICKTCSGLGYSAQRTVDLVARWNEERCFPPLALESILPTLKSAYREVPQYGDKD